MRVRHGTVTLWWASPGVAAPSWVGLLDPVENSRYAAHQHLADRSRFLVGAVAVRQLLAADLDMDPRRVHLDRTCERCGRPHGRVRLAEDQRLPGESLEVSVSHSGGWVVVAASRDGPVGVDVERVDPASDHVSLARAAFGDGDADALRRLPGVARAREFTRLWVRREAAVKASWPSRPQASPELQLHDVGVDEHHRAAVAVLGAPSVRVVSLDAAAILPTAETHSRASSFDV